LRSMGGERRICAGMGGRLGVERKEGGGGERVGRKVMDERKSGDESGWAKTTKKTPKQTHQHKKKERAQGGGRGGGRRGMGGGMRKRGGGWGWWGKSGKGWEGEGRNGVVGVMGLGECASLSVSSCIGSDLSESNGRGGGM